MSQCPALSGLASAGLRVGMNICIEHPRPSAREAPHLQPHWSSNLCSASPSPFEPFFENSTVEFFSPRLYGEFSQHWKAGLPWQQASSTGSRRFRKGDCCSWREGMESHLSRPISMQDPSLPWQAASLTQRSVLSKSHPLRWNESGFREPPRAPMIEADQSRSPEGIQVLLPLPLHLLLALLPLVSLHLENRVSRDVPSVGEESERGAAVKSIPKVSYTYFSGCWASTHQNES